MKNILNIFRKIEFKYMILPSIAFLVLTLIIFFNLGNHAFSNWDEAIYAQISKELVNSQNHFILTWGKDVWFQKPPLYLWLEGLSFKFFGISELSARFISAISGILLTILILKFENILFKNRRFSPLSIILIITAPFIIYYFRFATTDILSLLLTTTSLYYFIKSKSPDFENKSIAIYILLSAIFLGLAALTKGPVIAPAILTMILWSLAQIYPLKTTKLNLNSAIKKTVSFVAIFLLIVAPWHIYMYKIFGYQFIDQYFIYHMLGRSKQAIEGHSSSHLYYPRLILRNFPLIIPALILVFTNIKIFLKEKNAYLFLLIWFISTYFVTDFVSTKLDWYALPLFVPILIFTAKILYTAQYQPKKYLKIISFGLIVTTALYAIFLPYGTFKNQKDQNITKSCLQKYKSVLDRSGQSSAYIFGYYEPTARFYLENQNLNYYYDQFPNNNREFILTPPQNCQILKY